jgi:succinate-semialdehyde dehydrogenase/glutarate-semialdehyde dehydrogenase
VLNVITGSASEIGGEMTSNPIVKKVSFTGSTEVGKLLMEQCCTHGQEGLARARRQRAVHRLRRCRYRCGGRGAMASKYRNTGQTCVCVNRIYVQDSVYDAFAQKLSAAVGKLSPMNGLEPGATQGPLIDDKAVLKVEEHIADATTKGAKVVVGGSVTSAAGGSSSRPCWSM